MRECRWKGELLPELACVIRSISWKLLHRSVITGGISEEGWEDGCLCGAIYLMTYPTVL